MEHGEMACVDRRTAFTCTYDCLRLEEKLRELVSAAI